MNMNFDYFEFSTKSIYICSIINRNNHGLFEKHV